MNPGATSAAIIHLDAIDLSIAAVLVLAAGVISLLLNLGLGRRLALGAVRTVVQLLLLGYVLRIIFRIDNPAPLIVVLFIMLSAAGYTAVAHINRTLKGVYWIALFSLALTGLVTTFVVTGLVIGVDPWYQPRYVIPLAGMVFGNAMTGVSLSLDQLLDELSLNRDKVEMELAHGASRWEAARKPVRSAVRRGMIPIINTMMAVGLVSLPGMMTGQILAGADPVEAVKYQIVVMFMLTAATAFGCVASALLTFRLLFNDRHQLLVELIRLK